MAFTRSAALRLTFACALGSSGACIQEYSLEDLDESGGPECLEGETVCEGDCVNLRNDPGHCGNCGLECDENEVCENGSCVSACAPACDASTELCVEADCVCRPPYEACDGVCVDTSSDAGHCGVCRNPCDVGEACREGDCIPEGDCDYQSCGDACVDTDVHHLHCGGCDDPCDADQICVAGECILVTFPEVDCNSCPCELGCVEGEFPTCCFDHFADEVLCAAEGEC